MDTFQPSNEDQLAELIRFGLAENKRFSVAGYSSKAGFGRAPRADAEISCTALAGIREYDPAELVMQAGAGTSLTEITEALDKHNQYLAFEPMQLGQLYDANLSRSSIGGLFAANVSGSRRFVAGAARDHLLGFKAVNGRGEVYRSGGNVIKNVTGYDLSKLLCGSWGTLSVMTELSFKVLPKPTHSSSIVVNNISIRDGMNCLALISASPLQASGLAFIPDNTPVNSDSLKKNESNICVIRFEGTSISVQARMRDAETMLSKKYNLQHIPEDESVHLWTQINDVRPLRDESCIARMSVAPSKTEGLLQYVEEIEHSKYFVDAGGGWIWLSLKEENACGEIRKLRDMLADEGASLLIYKASDNIKNQAGVYSPMSPAMKSLQMNLKNSFDPENILNPDRLDFIS